VKCPTPLDDLPDDVRRRGVSPARAPPAPPPDAQNIDLMGLAGFCRNCLADWIREEATTATRRRRAS
jgi:hypothetical protein